MKQIFIVCTVLFLFGCTQKKEEISLQLIPVKQGEYWGYVDKDGKFVVNPQFKKAYTFSDGLALIENTAYKFGFIDEQGKLVISPVYKDALSFSEGLAAVVKENEKIEYIDNTGKTAFTPDANITGAQNFKDGLARVEMNDKTSFIDKTGKVVFTCQFEDTYYFSEGLALMSMKIKDDTKYGFLDKTGKIAINPQFEDASPFYENMAAVKMDNKFGFIDNTGKIIIAPQFENVQVFQQGLAAVKQGELWGFINKEGKFAINPQFKDVFAFTQSGLCVVKSATNDKWGFVDKEGKVKIEPQFESASPFYDDIAITELNKKYGIINAAGKYLANPVYEAYTLEKQGYSFHIESDYLDITGIANTLFKDITATAARGIQKDVTFSAMQTKFSGLTHDNYEHFKDFTKYQNSAMKLTEIHFEFNDGLKTTVTKTKTEQQYNVLTQAYETVTVPDGETTTYNDNIAVREVTFSYQLLNKALEKSKEIIKGLKGKLPANFTVNSYDSSTILLSNLTYGIILAEENDALNITFTFSPSMLNLLHTIKDISNATSTNPANATTDSIKK